MPEKLLNPTDAAELLRLHVETVRKLAREGRLPAVRVGGRWRFDPEALRDWLAANSNQVTTGA